MNIVGKGVSRNLPKNRGRMKYFKYKTGVTKREDPRQVKGILTFLLS